MRLAYSLVYRFVGDLIWSYTFANLKLPAITLTPFFSSLFLHLLLQNFSVVVLLHTASAPMPLSQALEKRAITRTIRRHLPMKNRQKSSKTKHQTTYSKRNGICNSPPVGFHSNISAGERGLFGTLPQRSSPITLRAFEQTL